MTCNTRKVTFGHSAQAYPRRHFTITLDLLLKYTEKFYKNGKGRSDLPVPTADDRLTKMSDCSFSRVAVNT